MKSPAIVHLQKSNINCEDCEENSQAGSQMHALLDVNITIWAL